MTIENCITAIKRYDSFLVTSHVDPEPDALGSELAVYELLRKLGKKAIVVNSDAVPDHYKFLEGVEVIKSRPERDDEYEAVVIVDCPTLKRCGKVKRFLKGVKGVINIDHHVSNDKFGTVNWVKSDASSAAEMVYMLYKKMGIDISKKVALYIYIAILTDTGSFNYSNTSSVTHEIVSELLGYGIHPHVISNFVYESKSYSDVKLLGKALSTLSLKDKGRICWIVCTNDMIKKTGSSVTATQDFVNFARSINGVVISMLIREEPGHKNSYKVSLRSKHDVCVNTIASIFGGGGHKHAAGCRVKGTLSEVKRKLLKHAREALRARAAMSIV